MDSVHVCRLVRCIACTATTQTQRSIYTCGLIDIWCKVVFKGTADLLSPPASRFSHPAITHPQITPHLHQLIGVCCRCTDAFLSTKILPSTHTHQSDCVNIKCGTHIECASWAVNSKVHTGRPVDISHGMLCTQPVVLECTNWLRQSPVDKLNVSKHLQEEAN